MSSPTLTERLIASNATWRPTWAKPPTMFQMRRAATSDEGPILVLTCMDPRCDPSHFLATSTRFATVKNAGGRATPDAVRSILVLRSLSLISEKGTVLVVHHTDCGMEHVTDEEIKADIKRRTPEETQRGEGIWFGTAPAEEFEETIRSDVDVLRKEKMLEGMTIWGMGFVTETGELREICT